MVDVGFAKSTKYPKLTYDIVVDSIPSGYIWRLEDDNEFQILVLGQEFSHRGTLESAIAELKSRLSPVENKESQDA